MLVNVFEKNRCCLLAKIIVGSNSYELYSVLCMWKCHKFSCWTCYYTHASYLIKRLGKIHASLARKRWGKLCMTIKLFDAYLERSLRNYCWSYKLILKKVCMHTKKWFIDWPHAYDWHTNNTDDKVKILEVLCCILHVCLAANTLVIMLNTGNEF